MGAGEVGEAASGHVARGGVPGAAAAVRAMPLARVAPRSGPGLRLRARAFQSWGDARGQRPGGVWSPGGGEAGGEGLGRRRPSVLGWAAGGRAIHGGAGDCATSAAVACFG